ncbi:glycosyltransferase family 4 protein [Candidatus Pelagibacter sp.]|uniref:glycosyltransferase family 4 protein n=1 Tax=Candidatus Pelagibacter sp. TaxID=2024849 RepID=UPI003F87D137
MKNTKILIDGNVLGMAIQNRLARTGIYFVIENICNNLLLNKNVDLKIISAPNFEKILQTFYKNHPFSNCLEKSSIKFGEEKINFLMPFHPADQSLYQIPNSKIFQIFYDFSFHFCPELNKENKNFEKQLINSINEKTYGLCISNKTKDDLLNLSKISSDKIEIFYPGLRDDLYNQIFNENKLNNNNSLNFLNIPKNANYVLCLSTIEPRKNFLTSLKVFERTLNILEKKDLYLVIVGEKGWGNSFSEIKKISVNLKDRIVFTGYVEDEYLFEIYKSALCFLYPSFYEGFGLPPLEAAAFGVPLILSNRGSLSEVFGEIGHIFDPYDIDGMSNTIIHLIENKSRDNFKNKSSIEFAKKFTWQKATDKILKFINKEDAYN